MATARRTRSLDGTREFVGCHANQFVRAVFDVGCSLCPGENEIVTSTCSPASGRRSGLTYGAPRAAPSRSAP